MKYEGFEHYETYEAMRSLGISGTLAKDIIETEWKCYWQGSRNDDGTPTERAERMMGVLYTFQLQRFIDLLPWDEEGKMPLGATKLCVDKFFSPDDPKILNDDTVMTEIENFPLMVYAFNIPTPEQVGALINCTDELIATCCARVI